MHRIGLIADFRFGTGAGPQVGKLLRHVGFDVVEIPRGLDPGEPANRERLVRFFQSVDVLYAVGKNPFAREYARLGRELKRRCVNHWIGTEVLTFLEHKETPEAREFVALVDLHLACAPWIAEELTEAGIQAQVVPIVSFDLKPILDPPPTRHAVLTYLLQGRSAFYGLDLMLAAAQALPHLPFFVVGNSGVGEPSRANVHYRGWLDADAMARQYADCSVFLRMPVHDGLSMMVIEALGKGKQVIYRYRHPHCHFAQSAEDVVRALEEITRGPPSVNLAGHEFVTRTLTLAAVGAQLRDVLDTR